MGWKWARPLTAHLGSGLAHLMTPPPGRHLVPIAEAHPRAGKSDLARTESPGPKLIRLSSSGKAEIDPATLPAMDGLQACS